MPQNTGMWLHQRGATVMRAVSMDLDTPRLSVRREARIRRSKSTTKSAMTRKNQYGDFRVTRPKTITQQRRAI